MHCLQSAMVILLVVSCEIEAQNIICGQRIAEHKALISNGLKTSHWPWHAAIYHQGKKPLPEYQCGGTLINANSILTAAHCISKSNKPLKPSIVSVSLGKLNLDVNESISAQSFEVAEIFQHPNYTSIDYANDIAIIRLSTNATFNNNYVRPVCMWPSNKLNLSEVIGREGTVVGWGFTETGEKSNVLQQASMPVVDSLQCLTSNRRFFGHFISDKTFCAGFRNGTGVCQGDSGGSMTFEEEDGSFYIRGIVSVGAVKKDKATGKTLCDSEQFSIYTDVAQYLPWINEVVAEKCEIDAQCDESYDAIGYHVCKSHLNLELSDQKCKIIFAAPSNNSVTWLSIVSRLEFDILPDLSDAVVAFKNLKVLEQKNTALKFVERTKLTAFGGIESLHLHNNEIDGLDSDTFDDLKNLVKLGVQNNKLVKIHEDLFSELHNLKELNLEDNALEMLPKGLFRNNENLEKIVASNNEMKEIHEDLFSELHNLAFLDLHGNELEILPKGLFRNTEKLEEIWASNNKIKEIHEDLFSELHNLKILYLDDNALEILPKGLFRNNEELRIFWAAKNKIRRIESDFQPLANLRTMDLRGNVCIDEDLTVSSLTQMQENIWRECKCDIEVQCEGEHEFPVCEVQLNLSFTEQKCKIIFSAISYTVVSWVTIRGEFDVLPDLSDAVVKFKKLGALKATHNKLKVVERTKLAAFSGIEQLHLGNNEINDLSSDTFDDLKLLTKLFIGFNNLTKIHEDLFSELYYLEDLNFAGNQLEFLPKGLFRNNEKLQFFWANDNKIKKIESDFQHLKNLYSIDFRGNVCISGKCFPCTDTDKGQLVDIIEKKCSPN